MSDAEPFLKTYQGNTISIHKLYCTTVGGGPCQLLRVF